MLTFKKRHMCKLIYHGTSREDYCRIRSSLPENMQLTPEPVCDRLRHIIRSSSPDGIIFPLERAEPEYFSHLRSLLALPNVPAVVVISPRLSAQQAVSCMRLGVADCFIGPVSGRIIGNSFRKISRQRPLTALQKQAMLLHGGSHALSELQRLIIRYAQASQSVFITGETGTGKELTARALHMASPRSNGPFTAINCAVYPEDILSLELFGSRRGAFTGSTDRPGLFETCRGGTLFLDEVTELSLKNQAALLRVLEEKIIRRIGSPQSIPVNVRILSATNSPMAPLLEHHQFRQDLFFRLSPLSITVPPLRKRKEDIFTLAEEYLSTLPSGQRQRIDSTAYCRLVHHKWPGNVRELQSVILKASLQAKNGIIRASDIQL